MVIIQINFKSLEQYRTIIGIEIEYQYNPTLKYLQNIIGINSNVSIR